MVARVRRGRCSPVAGSDCSSRSGATGLSRSSSGNGSELSSLADTPPRTPTAAAMGRPRMTTGRVLLRALLPAVVLLLTALSMHRRRVEHGRLADELLEAAAWPAGRRVSSGAVREQPDTSRQCAEALQVPQVGDGTAMAGCG